MTNATPGPVEVTQADREAYLQLNNLPKKYADAVRAGVWDQMTGMQILARHRIEAARPVQSELVEADRNERRVRIQQALLSTLGDTYDCTRVWEAWNVGTMDRDDFVPVLDRLEELVDEIDAAITKGTGEAP